jgi:hypothetical protein
VLDVGADLVNCCGRRRLGATTQRNTLGGLELNEHQPGHPEESIAH